jgi:hypothetical protein
LEHKWRHWVPVNKRDDAIENVDKEWDSELELEEDSEAAAMTEDDEDTEAQIPITRLQGVSCPPCQVHVKQYELSNR